MTQYRTERQTEIERVMLDHLGDRGMAWATAMELAHEVGYPWRAVARVLIRLAQHNCIEQAKHEWRSNRQRTRVCFKYRQVVTNVNTFPTWLMPQMPAQKPARAVAQRQIPQTKKVRTR